MPKSTNEKNNKGKKATTKTTTTKATAKKTQPAKKVVKKVETKTTPKKKIEVKKANIKTEAKKVEVKEVAKKEEKGFKEVIIEKIENDKPFTISLCIIVVLLAALIFTACYKRIPKTSDGKQVLATLKGKTITADDLYAELKEEKGTDALLNIIDTYIADKEVKVTKDDKAYVDEVVDYYKNYAEYYGVDLPTFLANYVGLSGITTEDEFKDYVLKDYKKTLAVTKFIGDNAKEEDLKAYYKENYTDKLNVKHILIEVDAEAEDQDAADKEALDKAKDLIEQLNNTKKDKLDSKFEKLAEDNSDDTATYSKGGLIENITKNDVEEAFWNAANKLKNGEYTKEPVKTSYGYHVILRVSSTKADKYSDIKNEVKKAYAQSLLSSDTTILAKKWDELRKQYKLSIKDDLMKKAYKENLKAATNTTEENTEKTEE